VPHQGRPVGECILSDGNPGLSMLRGEATSVATSQEPSEGDPMEEAEASLAG